jgi:hypothetical protein
MDRSTSPPLPRLLILGAIIALACLTLACGFISRLVSSSTPAPTPIRVMDLEGLVFEDPTDGERLMQLDRCVKGLASANDWKFIPYTQMGNGLRAYWCGGRGARSDCIISGSDVDPRDQRVVTLWTLFYPQQFPRVFSMGISALNNPPGEGWSAFFVYSEHGKNITGEGLHLKFYHYPAADKPPDAHVFLDLPYTYSTYILRDPLTLLTPELPLSQELPRFTASPEALRDHGLEILDQAAQQGEYAILSHTHTACEHLEPPFPSVLPPCTPRPPSALEESEMIAKLQAEFAAQQQALRENYAEMYTALMQVLPLDRCWQ